MKKWEYDIDTIEYKERFHGYDINLDEDIFTFLTRKGEEGWELVSVSGKEFIFKRRKD